MVLSHITQLLWLFVLNQEHEEMKGGDIKSKSTQYYESNYVAYMVDMS